MAFITTRTTADGTSYRVQWRHGGRQHVRTFTALEHAESWRVRLDLLGHNEALALLDTPPPPPDMPTVDQAVVAHITGLTGVEDGTRRKYESNQRLHISPALGDLPLDLLTYDRAAAWVNGMERAGKSGKTIRNVHSLLSSAMTSAVRRGQIPENVVKGLRLPEPHAEEMVFLDAAEMGRMVALTPEHWRPLVAMLFTSGMRFGEASALEVQHVDLDRATIRIRQAWKETTGKGHKLGPPKSPRARRTIPIPRDLVPSLAATMKGRSPSDWLFLNTRGDPVRHGSFHSHVWTPLVHEFAGDTLEKTGKVGRRRHTWVEDGHGKRPRIHDARHSFAAAAIAAGYSMTSLQRHMGHETIKTTSDTYGHLFQADRDAYATVVRMPADLLAIGT